MNLRRSVLVFLCMVAANSVQAHLCNDVFIQARDNLAVKVDIRDDQLRIKDEAKFRVYLLNTMDRDIVDIRLDVISEQFKGDVKPSPDWKGFPKLRATGKGGKKEFFEVTLRRKSGVTEGKYQIGLHLYNGKNPSMVFKTVDIGDAMALQRVPSVAKAPVIDGKAERTEWESSLLCTGLSEYHKQGKYFENREASSQTRFRFVHDKTTLYALVDFIEGGSNDVASIYVSGDGESVPTRISANLQSGVVEVDGKADSRIRAAKDGNRIEIAIPFAALGKSDRGFYVNLTRERDKQITFWRGNPMSIQDPVSYANFVLD